MRLQSKNIKLKGELLIKKYNEHNRLVQELKVPNLVVTTGKQYVASRMAGTSAAVMSHMAVGSLGTAPVLANTVLNTETGRVALGPTTVTGSIVSYSATFGPNVATGQVVEAGIFNAETGGTMLCHTVFPVINKDENETIVITWNVSVG